MAPAAAGRGNTWVQACCGCALALTACALLAREGRATATTQAVVALHAGLFVLPCLMWACLSLAAALLTLLTALLCVPHWLLRRPTGFADLAQQAWRIPAAVLPGYLRALRRVRSPLLWGAVAGTAAWLATHLGGIVA